MGVNLGRVENSNADCFVQMFDIRNWTVACFAGENRGSIKKSKSRGQVSGSYSGGGFAGYNEGEIEQCISYAMVNDGNYSGGFVSRNSNIISYCYCASINNTAGFVDYNTGSIFHSYNQSITEDILPTAPADYFGFGSGGVMQGNIWNSGNEEIENLDNEIIGLTTLEMKNAANYINAGWDFVGETANGTEDIWAIHPRYNNGYPFLSWEAPSQTFVGGSVYYDRNEDGLNNESDVPIGNLQVILQPEGTRTGTAHDGSYIFYAEPGEHTVSIVPQDPYYKGIDTLQHSLTVELLQDTVLPSTGLYGEDILDADMQMGTTWSRCGRTVPLWVVVTSKGNVPANLELTMKIDSRVTLQETSLPIESTDADGTMHFAFNALEPYESRTLEMSVLLPTATTDSVSYTAELLHGGTAVKSQTTKRLIRCSYDPNDIQVFPEGLTEHGFVPMEQELTYFIRFQNTGNDTAFMVDILDTLAPCLNPDSFQFLSSSHEVRYFVEQNGALRFLFEDINLLDSTSNEPESHGFVMFSVQPRENTAVGTIAETKAHIYFDYNPAIVTNRVTCTFTDKFTPIEQTIRLNEGWNLISLYVQPENDTLSSILGGISSEIIQIKNNDKYYDASNQDYFNTLLSLEGGRAYFIKASDTAEIAISGLPVFTPYSEELQQGWNLVGYPLRDSTAVSQITEGSTINSIKNFEGFWRPGEPLNTIIRFEPGVGYFIYCEEPAVLQWEE